jgi:hypothetical protein
MSYKVSKDGVVVNPAVSGTLEAIQNAYPDHEYELIPPRPEPTHKEEFSPEELLNSFTTDEAFLAVGSLNSDVIKQFNVLKLKRDIIINKDDAGYQSAINLLEAEGVLTADRAADYRNGIPI